MNKIVLYLIRHGKTLCNERRLYCGKSDVSLSELGYKEILKLKSTVDYPKCRLN
ncbi:histidine phosphatase family protein, partial [Clostridium sp.]